MTPFEYRQLALEHHQVIKMRAEVVKNVDDVVEYLSLLLLVETFDDIPLNKRISPY